MIDGEVIIEEVGGVAVAALILRLQTDRYVREVYAGKKPMPPEWYEPLKNALEIRRDRLNTLLKELPKQKKEEIAKLRKLHKADPSNRYVSRALSAWG